MCLLQMFNLIIVLFLADKLLAFSSVSHLSMIEQLNSVKYALMKIIVSIYHTEWSTYFTQCFYWHLMSEFSVCSLRRGSDRGLLPAAGSAVSHALPHACWHAGCVAALSSPRPAGLPPLLLSESSAGALTASAGSTGTTQNPQALNKEIHRSAGHSSTSCCFDFTYLPTVVVLF